MTGDILTYEWLKLWALVYSFPWSFCNKAEVKDSKIPIRNKSLFLDLRFSKVMESDGKCWLEATDGFSNKI